LNFDIFISPSYLINIKYQSLNGNKSEYADNLQIFYLQVGLSYIIQ